MPGTRESGQDLPLPWDDTPQELYDQAPCGYLTILPDGTVVNVNETFLAWTGFGRADLIGRKRLRDLLGVGSLIYYETHVAPLLRMQGEIREIALDVRCAGGRRLPTLVNATVSHDADGAERVIRVTVFDATERRRYETELLHARWAAEESERRVRVLQQVVADLAAVPTASGVARALVGAAGPAFGAADGALWVVDGDRGLLVLAAGAADAGYTDVPLASAGAAAVVVRKGEPIVVESAERLHADLPEWAGALHRRGRQAMLLVPLTAHDGVLGVLACAFTEARTVSDAELRLAVLLGQQAGQALDRARLYDEARLREERAVLLGELSRALDEIPDLFPRAQRLVDRIVPVIAEHAEVRLAGMPDVLASAGDPWPGSAVETVLPLTVRGTVSGTLTLRLALGRAPADAAFLAELAYRAGLALENARLYEREREVASTLQRSLLAGEPPGDVRFAVETHYRPSAGGLEVGGDWHDAFLITPDRLALVVGDVVGRGLHAASTMGQLRSAVRALAAAEAGPARLVEQLDRFVDRHEPARMATVAYAEIDLRTGVMTYCCAGHMPPLALPAHAGAETLWEGRSAPLGSRAGRTLRPEATVHLAQGDRLLLYTDGLVERRDRPLDDGLERLAAAFEARRRSPIRGLTARLADALLVADQPDDDVCLLCFSLGAEPRLERSIPADPHRIASLRTELRGWLVTRGVDEESRDALLLALSEAVANAIEHGYRGTAHGVVTLTATVSGEAVVLRVRDHGSWREPRGDDPARGRGLFLIGEVTDAMEIDRDGGTTVTMRRRLTRE